MVFRSLFTWTIFFLFTSFLQHGQVFCLEGGKCVCEVRRKQSDMTVGTDLQGVTQMVSLAGGGIRGSPRLGPVNTTGLGDPHILASCGYWNPVFSRLRTKSGLWTTGVASHLPSQSLGFPVAPG